MKEGKKKEREGKREGGRRDGDGEEMKRGKRERKLTRNNKKKTSL